MTRVYLPSSISGLRDEVGTRAPTAQPGTTRAAYAVTASLCAAVPEADQEELEYLAMTLAARASVGCLADAEPPRRLVIAFDVDGVREAGPESPGLVSADPIGRGHLVSFHLDAADAEPAVARAQRALTRGEDAAEELVVACDDHELGWYAATEVDVVGRLGAAGVG